MQALPTPEHLALEYREVVATWRGLGARRFQLLGLLPTGTVAILVTAQDAVPPTVLGGLGLAVTVALCVYNARNDQHYDELVARAAELERRLGLVGGSFNQRPQTWFAVPLGPFSLPIEHRWPVSLVYAAVAAAWLAVCLGVLLPQPWAAGVAIGGVAAVWRSVAGARAAQSRVWRDAVRRAALALAQVDLSSGGKVRAARLDAIAGALASSLGGSRKRVDRDAVVARLSFALEAVASDTHDDPGAALDLGAASHAVAGAIDMPARWVYDVASGRR